MTIPFLSYFKKVLAKEPATAPVPTHARVEKPSSERLSKTVTPNATRAPQPADPYRLAAAGPASRTVAFSTPAPAPRDLPPAVAFALEPKVERAISLELSEVMRHMPAGFVRTVEKGDASRRVLLKASELERGMACGKPSVSIATIYEQAPEIFVRPLSPSDCSQVELPFQKVMEQFSSLHVRTDQKREVAVPQVETPFLKLTLEDDTRFGTVTEVLATAPTAPVRLQPATAETLAAAEPEPAAPEKSSPPVPARIPFNLSPKGTDAPANEGVPASGGPSVPTSAPCAPTRIPFNTSELDEAAPPALDAWLTAENFTGEAVPAPDQIQESKGPKDEGIKIALALKPILKSLPPFQVTSDISGVSEDARLEVPFALIEPQLASGKVALRPQEFIAALPEEYRGVFDAREAGTTVPLPLQEVLRNLPEASLQMRADQVEQEQGENFATPFSTKAEEDAKRFASPEGAGARGSVLASAPPPAATEVPAEQPAQPAVAEQPAQPSVPAARTALQSALDTDDELDAKTAVAHVNRMPGVDACALMFSDGLSLAGNLPERYQADGLCAMAPSFLQRIENHMVEAKLGALRAMTLSCTEAAITFFIHDNLCLAALHSKEELASDVRERLDRALRELSKKYSHPV